MLCLKTIFDLTPRSVLQACEITFSLQSRFNYFNKFGTKYRKIIKRLSKPVNYNSIQQLSKTQAPEANRGVKLQLVFFYARGVLGNQRILSVQNGILALLPVVGNLLRGVLFSTIRNSLFANNGGFQPIIAKKLKQWCGSNGLWIAWTGDCSVSWIRLPSSDTGDSRSAGVAGLQWASPRVPSHLVSVQHPTIHLAPINTSFTEKAARDQVEVRKGRTLLSGFLFCFCDLSSVLCGSVEEDLLLISKIIVPTFVYGCHFGFRLLCIIY